MNRRTFFARALALAAAAVLPSKYKTLLVNGNRTGMSLNTVCLTKLMYGQSPRMMSQAASDWPSGEAVASFDYFAPPSTWEEDCKNAINWAHQRTIFQPE